MGFVATMPVSQALVLLFLLGPLGFSPTDAAPGYVEQMQTSCINTVAGGVVAGTQSLGLSYVAFDASGSLVLTTPSTVLRLEADGSTLTPFAGSGTTTGYADGLGRDARFNDISGVARTRRGVVVSDRSNNALRTISANNSVETLVGGPGATRLNGPWGMVVDPATDTIYFKELDANTVRSCDVQGNVATLAGTSGQSGTTGDGGPGVDALLYGPVAIAFDPRGTRSLVFSDSNNAVIRRLDLGTGVISLVAGTYGSYSTYSPDGTIAIDAVISGYNYGVALRPSDGAVIFSDAKWRVVRAIVGGVLWTIAGTGTFGTEGDGGPATLALMQYPYGCVLCGSAR